MTTPKFRSKVCFKCHAEKPLGEFHKHPGMTDGHLNKCKDCACKDVRENRRRNVEHYAEYERERFKTEDRKRQVARYRRRRKLTNPEKYAAHCIVSNAIRDGKLVRDPCEVCGNAKSQAHHKDYAKPLDVQWLCFTCHRKAHGQQPIFIGALSA